MQDARNMPPPYHYPGRRDPEQEAEDKRRTRTSNRDAMEAAARAERAAFLAHIRGTPGELSVRNMMPSWDTYKNSPEMSGNTAMTDYISRYNAKNPQRAFKPEVYKPQARPAAPAAPAVAPAAPQSRVMQNVPAVGVQAAAPANESIEDYTKRTNQITGAEPDSYKPAQDSSAPPYRAPDPMIALAQGAPASGAQQPGPLDTLQSASKRQAELDKVFSTVQRDDRPGARYGWVDDGRGQKLMSAPDPNDPFRGGLQDAINAQSEARVNAAVNGTKVDPRTQTDAAARATAAAATAPRAVAFAPAPTALTPQQLSASGAPSDAFNGLVTTQGTTAFARPAGSPAMAGAGIYDNGKNTKSATPRTDQEVTGNASMLAGANTADPNSVASQAIDAVSAVKKKPMAPTSAVKASGAGAAGLGLASPFAGLALQGVANTMDASTAQNTQAADATNAETKRDTAAAAAGDSAKDAFVALERQNAYSKRAADSAEWRKKNPNMPWEMNPHRADPVMAKYGGG